MTARTPLVLAPTGTPQQLQPGDVLSLQSIDFSASGIAISNLLDQQAIQIMQAQAVNGFVPIETPLFLAGY